ERERLGALAVPTEAPFGDVDPVGAEHPADRADPTGTVLLMLNDDVPGVIGTVGGVLGAHGINIAEWRLGRNSERSEALSFINLDAHPPSDLVDELRALKPVNKAVIVEL
ncbi:MAG: ACT domain-containing protein, partial [Actinomycetota bacterium]